MPGHIARRTAGGASRSRAISFRPMPPEDVSDDAPVDSIVELTRALVRLPTRAGIDAYEPAFTLLEDWLHSHGAAVRRLAGPGGATVALMGCPAETAKRWYVLNATVDTAPFGDESTWTRPPTGADIEGGWMYGRGTADCKVGVAIFAHLIVEAAIRPPSPVSVAAVFDADEHTGGFAGIRAYLDEPSRRRATAGVFVGYPGPDKIVVGGRGFLRAVLHVAGQSAHSGSRRPTTANAVARAARLVTRLDGAAPPNGDDPDFPVPPKVTVTAVRGGEGFSIIPDRCTVAVDVRLTPRFDVTRAQAYLGDQVAAVDREDPGPRPTTVDVVMTRPAYRLPQGSALAAALQSSAEAALGRRPPLEIVGPSSVGNLLAQAGIEATAGFGVGYRNLHAVDEAIDLSTIGPVYRAYRGAARRLTADGEG